MDDGKKKKRERERELKLVEKKMDSLDATIERDI